MVAAWSPQVPHELAQLKSLVRLDLSMNRLTNQPEFIAVMRREVPNCYEIYM
jgi:hypothetical protein